MRVRGRWGKGRAGPDGCSPPGSGTTACPTSTSALRSACCSWRSSAWPSAWCGASSGTRTSECRPGRPLPPGAVLRRSERWPMTSPHPQAIRGHRAGSRRAVASPPLSPRAVTASRCPGVRPAQLTPVSGFTRLARRHVSCDWNLVRRCHTPPLAQMPRAGSPRILCPPGPPRWGGGPLPGPGAPRPVPAVVWGGRRLPCGTVGPWRGLQPGLGWAASCCRRPRLTPCLRRLRRLSAPGGASFWSHHRFNWQKENGKTC